MPAPGSHLLSSWETKGSLFLLLVVKQQVHFAMGWSNGWWEKVCLSLSTCSILINSEKCHIPFVQWTFHHPWRFGWSSCRRGPKSWRASHTFSRSFASSPRLMTAAYNPGVCLPPSLGNLQEASGLWVHVSLSETGEVTGWSDTCGWSGKTKVHVLTPSFVVH